MIKVQKAKTYFKDKIKDLTGTFAYSIKYDGYQISILKVGTSVKFFTSSNKRFNIEYLSNKLKTVSGDFLLICEYMHGTEGKLGDRGLSAKLNTYISNYKKDVSNDVNDEKLTRLKVFDCIKFNHNTFEVDVTFKDRLLYMKSLVLPVEISTVDFKLGSFDSILKLLDSTTAVGWEGLMAINVDSMYKVGKRVHHAIKIKRRLTVDLICVDTFEGKGKFKDEIGGLICKDSHGRLVNVGSGLTTSQRKLSKSTYIDKVIEISYERLADTYIQPVFKYIRLDKSIKNID